MAKLGLHVQEWNGGALEACLRSRPPIVKVMSNAVDPVRQVLAAMPDTILVLRRFFEQSEQEDMLRASDPEAQGRGCARIVIGRFTEILNLHPQRVYLESLNETGLDTLADAYNAFTVGFAQECARQGLRPAVYSFPVGNPSPPDDDGLRNYWSHYMDGLRAAHAAGGALSKHEYSWPTMQTGTSWLCLRYRRDYAVFPPDLQALPLLLTEVGLDRGVAEGVPDAPNTAGWRSSSTTPQEYADQLRWYDAEISQDRQVLGATIFTCGGFWPSFDVAGVTEIEAVIAEQEEPPMTITDTKLTLASDPVLDAGHSNLIVVEASGVDQGIFTLIINLDARPDGTAYTTDPVLFGGLIVGKDDVPVLKNGRNILRVPVNAFDAPGPVHGRLRISVAELDGTAFETGDKLSVDVTVNPSSGAEPPIVVPDTGEPAVDAKTPAGILLSREAAMWGRLWDIKDRLPKPALEAFVGTVQWGKGEREDMPDFR